ncbi:hypothetical protein [Rhodanobacter sp. BL-MT-08]
MFKSQTASTSRLPHLATAVALMVTVAIGVMQSSASAAPVANASIATR